MQVDEKSQKAEEKEKAAKEAEEAQERAEETKSESVVNWFRDAFGLFQLCHWP